MKKDALLLVDVQNDFCPGGALAVPEGDRVIPVLNQYVAQFQKADLPIFASRDWHPAVTKHFKAYGGPWPPHCIQGTKGADFHPGLKLPKGAVVISKGMDPEKDSYSAFHGYTEGGTDFEKALKKEEIIRIYIGGLATDYCVKHSVLDALKKGFETFLLEDAVRGVEVHPGDSEKAVKEMVGAGTGRIRLQDLTFDRHNLKR